MAFLTHIVTRMRYTVASILFSQHEANALSGKYFVYRARIIIMSHDDLAHPGTEPELWLLMATSTTGGYNNSVEIVDGKLAFLALFGLAKLK